MRTDPKTIATNDADMSSQYYIAHNFPGIFILPLRKRIKLRKLKGKRGETSNCFKNGVKYLKIEYLINAIKCSPLRPDRRAMSLRE